MLELTKFGSTIENAFEEKAPHKICAYIYEVLPMHLTVSTMRQRSERRKQIGHGGGGSLYLAKDMELGICRAVKEIPIAKKKEARPYAASGISCNTEDYGLYGSGEYCYLIMEYIKGQSLGELLR